MKNNTKDTKAYLQKALQNIPNDFALSEVKFYIQTALQKLETVERKRESRERVAATPHNTWWKMINGQLVNPYTPITTLRIIDEMIADEEQKLEDLARKKNEKNKPDSEVEDLRTLTEGEQFGLLYE